MMCNALYEFGKCTVLIRHPTGEAEPGEVERNRRQIVEAIRLIESDLHERPMDVEVDFRDDLYREGVPETAEAFRKLTERIKQDEHTHRSGGLCDRPGTLRPAAAAD